LRVRACVITVRAVQNPIGEWGQFMTAYMKAVRGQSVSETGLRYLLGELSFTRARGWRACRLLCLDNAGLGNVSLYKFCEFLKSEASSVACVVAADRSRITGFGPLLESPRRVNEVLSAEWFHGYLSSEEAVM
jgi:hypothetical protein